MEDCDLRQAAETLATICRIDLAPPRPAQPKAERSVPKPSASGTKAGNGRRGASRGRGSKEAEEPETALYEPHSAVMAHIVDEVANPPLRFALKLDPAHSYLQERGLSAETIETFGIGLCRKGSMAGRIAIPIHNEEGQLVAYAGRWPGDNGWPAGEDRYKLPPGFHKGRVLFNLHRVQGAKHLVVVEGYWSVFRLRELGIPAVALMGSSLSEQEELLAEHGPDRLTLLLDADPAGNAATGDILPRLAHRHFVYSPELPDGSSPDSVEEDVLTSLFADLVL